MYNPVSTYRIQFNKDYTFKNFKENIEYFYLLNPGAIYASPIFEAAPGSMHGYNVTNPNTINPEIGKYVEFAELSDELKLKNIGWIQDIVPNHMAFHMKNGWLMDVLEKGRSSKYFQFFDVDFSHPYSKNKIIVPFLGKNAKEAAKDGEIKLGWQNGSFELTYYDFHFPVNFHTFKFILKNSSDALDRILKNDKITGESEASFLQNEWQSIKLETGRLFDSNDYFSDLVKNIIQLYNSDSSKIEEVLDQQHYLLAHWQESLNNINYRRFFTVSSLICLRMEDDALFDVYHSFIGQQVLKKRFNGLRIDHIDGLQKPLKYIEKLRLLTGNDTYIVAEKILEKDEELINDTPLQGTSGYDYLAIVNNLFTYSKNYPDLAKFYRKITGIKDDTEEIIYQKKKFILAERMHGEWDNLFRMFDESEFVVYGGEITRETIKQAIGEFLLFFPVYKLYSDYFPVAEKDANILKQVFEKAIKKNPSISKSLNALKNVFILQAGFDAERREKALQFFLRCMQFSGPLMAKGVEDTTMYYYNCFIGHNEVGDAPDAQGITIEEYHDKMAARYRNWPLAMNATSTHDTKRGEDVRARLNVLSELPDEWMKHVENWMKINKPLKILYNDIISPTDNEEYFIYQTLIGVFPHDSIPDNNFVARMNEYLVKSLREAKMDTNWNEPNEAHEKAVLHFVLRILEQGSQFLSSFIPFQQKISNYAIINSLSQLTLKVTSPGVPDFYQGTEFWDLSMVDPDNRRPVNYDLRLNILKEMKEHQRHDPEGFFQYQYNNRGNGRIKLWMTYQLIQERRSDPDLFLHGKYLPLHVSGKYHDHVLAFARSYNNSWFITIIPLYLAVLPDNRNRHEPGFINWEDTKITLPDTAPKKFSSSFGRNEIHFDEYIYLSEVMKFPCPLFLKAKVEAHKRFAGILTHISSLPGDYGTGDLGEEAYQFVDFLCKSGQSYWQILPFNPVEKKYGYSPYSSQSAFAGNLTFLSPELLLKSRLLSGSSLEKVKFTESQKSDFKKAHDFRIVLLEEVFCNFKGFGKPFLQKDFNDFCEREHYWLNDYVMFVILKQEFNEAPWNEWPENIKNHEKDAINEYVEKYGWEIEKEKFCQYLFYKQWIALKEYANKSGIKLIGDMSFYVNYDSADVWSNPQFFKLDHHKNPLSIAGVPPDYFSNTGQLWNMPVYNWDTLKGHDYTWWLKRIKRNMDLCDLVRFDHFRGFSAYWEVPAGETTAINGRWIDGPGNDFFDRIKKEFPTMPFIAEDLGMIDEKVYKLRDDFSLPGMVVLQFAFGDETPKSNYIPHNHIVNSIVYTGTHDNNTIKGWYRNELGNKYKKTAETYIGHTIHDSSCQDDFIRMAYSSVSQIAVIPIQDLLGLDETARLNKPSTTENNWDWKLKRKDLKKEFSDKLRKMAVLFGRI